MPNSDRTLDCRRFVSNDREGFLGLLAMLKRLSADHSRAEMDLPADVDQQGLLPEYSFGYVERRVLQKGMARVVNVMEALRLAKARGEGTPRIAVSDVKLNCPPEAAAKVFYRKPAFISRYF